MDLEETVLSLILLFVVAFLLASGVKKFVYLFHTPLLVSMHPRKCEELDGQVGSDLYFSF